MFKRTMLFGGMALAAVALMAPAAAQAGWTHEGEPFGEHATVDLFGEFRFDVPSLGSTFGCSEVNAELTMVSGNSGFITEFAPNTSSCSGTGPVFEGCKLVNDTSSKLPWTVHTNPVTRSFIFTNMTIFYSYEGCKSGAPWSHVTFEEVSATPDNSNEFSTFTLEASQFGVTATGHFEVTNVPGTYGIE